MASTSTNKQLTVKLKLNISNFESQIKRAIKMVDQLNKAMGKAPTSYEKTVRITREATEQTRRWSACQRQLNRYIQEGNGLLRSTTARLRGVISTYLGIMGMKATANLSDTFINAQNKLNYVNANNMGNEAYNEDGSYSSSVLKATQDSMDKMYNSSQKVRMSYTDMMSNVSKSMALAGDAFQGNIDNAIRFQEIMAESYALGGASAAEMSSSMYQMIQALGSGTLAGDELRSVREGAPLAYQAIEKFAQGVYNTEESLKDLASQGKITSKMVVAAVMNAGNELDTAFAQAEQTFAQTWTQIKNAAIKAFAPVAELLKDTLNEAVENGFVDKLETAFTGVSYSLQIAFGVIKDGVTWIYDHWEKLDGLIVASLTTWGSMLAIQGAVAIYDFMAKYWWLVLIAVAIFAIVWALYEWQNAQITTTEAITYCLLGIALIILVIGLLIGNIPMLIIAAIVAVLGLIVGFFDYVCGAVWWTIRLIIFIVQFLLAVIIESFMTIGRVLVMIIAYCLTVIWNCITSTWNWLVSVFENVMNAFLWVCEFIANVCLDGFNSLGDGIANIVGNIISWFLNLGTVVTTIIDAICGTSWTSQLKKLGDEVSGWGKNDKAVTLERADFSEYKLDAHNPGGVSDKIWNFGRFEDKWFKGSLTAGESLINGKAWDEGFTFGSSMMTLGNILGDVAKDYNGKESKGNFLEDMAKKLGIDLTDPFESTKLNDLLTNFDMSNLLGDIKTDTGDIKDSMDLTNDDLEYLRKIAEMEWRNEFTTAEIRVDMTNNNTVNGERDLDGIVTYLSDVLKEEMHNVAYGVHY